MKPWTIIYIDSGIMKTCVFFGSFSHEKVKEEFLVKNDNVSVLALIPGTNPVHLQDD